MGCLQFQIRRYHFDIQLNQFLSFCLLVVHGSLVYIITSHTPPLQDYPFKARKRHGLDYVRQFPHLRARTNSFSSLLRIRDTATKAIHDFFRKENFIQVHTPILTSSDCEGAGDLFEVKVTCNQPRSPATPTSFLTAQARGCDCEGFAAC